MSLNLADCGALLCIGIALIIVGTSEKLADVIYPFTMLLIVAVVFFVNSIIYERRKRRGEL